MRAWRLHELGAPTDVLKFEDGVETPKPGPGQVRLEMAATGLNFFENLLCRGQYQEKPPLPLTPGAEL
ncbi:MAG: NADPH:quinone oxidoreductase family protein, partial [Actinobacteria bacterium]|nr:NADPH:quinone oxidoreductase family protein [Actinomycetota bacterium]